MSTAQRLIIPSIYIGLSGCQDQVFQNELDHPGWAPAACLLVARPQLDLLQSRGIGRVRKTVFLDMMSTVLDV